MKKTFFQAPEYLSLPLFGLNIVKNQIRVVKLKKTKNGQIPEYFETFTTPDVCDFFTTSDSQNPCDSLKEVLKSIKQKTKMTFAHVSISEDQTYIFKMQAPQEAKDSLADFISNNLDQYIPLQSTEVQFDYKIIKNNQNQNNISLVVTAIPRFIIEKYAALLESCGIYMVGCEPETHALVRAIIDKGDVNPYISINIDDFATRISVIENGLVQYSQTVSVVSADVKGEISVETTQKLKDIINRVIIFWFTSKDSNVHPVKIQNLILTGVDVDSPELVHFFENNLAVHVAHANVWKNCFDLTSYIPELSKKDSLGYVVAIGLSMFNLK